MRFLVQHPYSGKCKFQNPYPFRTVHNSGWSRIATNYTRTMLANRHKQSMPPYLHFVHCSTHSRTKQASSLLSILTILQKASLCILQPPASSFLQIQSPPYLVAHYIGPPNPPLIPCSLFASCGYFSWTSSCVLVASA
jgi:hypothetical protein